LIGSRRHFAGNEKHKDERQIPHESADAVLPMGA
jgi:hypothetical protein